MVDAFRILFADDEETFLFSTADLLRREGYEVDCVPDVAAARRMLQQNTYDLLIADIMMPGNCELEFVRQLTELTEPLPVILVTGYPSVDSARQSVELPVVAYVVKPFNFDELLSKVHLAARSVGIRRMVRTELARVQEYRHGLVQIESLLRHQPRGTQAAALESLAGMTLRNLLEGLTNLQSIAEASGERESSAGIPMWVGMLPREIRDILRDAVATLERTKTAFKSKELGELRKRLEALLNA